MADIIDFSTLHGASSKDSKASGLLGVENSARTSSGAVVGTIGGAGASQADAGGYEHPVPQCGQQARLMYAAGASLPPDVPEQAGRLAIELATHATGEASITITAPASEVAPAVHDAQTALARSVGIDVRDLSSMQQLRATLGDEALATFEASFVQQQFLQLALRRTGIEPYLAPDLSDPALIEEGKDYTFTANFLLRPTVELSSYEPVEFEFPKKPEITSQDVSDYLDQMADQLATYEEDYTRTEASAGDIVTISMRASYEDGRPFASLTRSGVRAQVGMGMLPEELDRNLEGMPVRSTRDVSVSFPMPDENGGVAYTVITVRLTLDHVDRKVPALINDAWVMQNAPAAGTLLGLRSQIRTMLEKDAEAAYQQELSNKAVDTLAQRLQTPIGDAYVERMYKQIIGRFELELANQGIDFQTYVSQPDFDLEAFGDRCAQEALEQISGDLAMDALADHLGIEVDEKELQQAIAEAVQSGATHQSMRELTESGQLEQVRRTVRRSQAINWLLDTARDSSGPKLQLI